MTDVIKDPTVADAREGAEPEQAGAAAVAAAAAADAPPTLSARGVGVFRWTICALLFFSTTINYMDRQVIGLLKHQLSIDLGWTEQGYANIVTAFQLAYALGYLFGGRLMDRFGVKRGLPIAAALWSVAAIAHGFVRTIPGFAAARLGLGLAEGGNFPAAIKAVSEWFPIKERALATGIFNCGSTIGAIICPLLVPWLAVSFGWPMAFIVTGALGFIWVVAWVLLYESPEKNPRLSPAERAYIEGGRAPSATAAPAEQVPWLSLLSYRATWAYLAANVLSGPVWWFYLFWIPDFLQKRFDLKLTEITVPVMTIYAISSVGSVLGGWLPTRLINAGKSLNVARKTAMLICACCVVPVFGAASVPSLWGSVLLVGLAAAAHQGWSANLYSFVSDTMPKRAVSSLVGMGGLVAGLISMGVAQAVAQVLEKTGSYVPLFIWASTMYLLSLLALHLLVPNIGPSVKALAEEQRGRYIDDAR